MPDRLAARSTRVARHAIAGLLAITLAALTLSCDDSTPIVPHADFTGTWTLTITVVGGSTFPLEIELTQDGQSVSGTFGTPGVGANGTLSGWVSGNYLTFDIFQAPPCPGTATGSAVYQTDGTVAGSYGGTFCNGTIETTFTGAR